jgi:NOL1/NOP2/fmu family ribosome biogenesis protein
MFRGIMNKLKILNTRETRVIYDLLEKQWGFKAKLDYVFLMNDKSNIFITNRDFSRIELKKLRINNIGVYFGEIMDGERLRLSIEGSQIIGDGAKKNIAQLNDKETLEWLQGNTVEKDFPDGILIIRTPYGYAGSGTIKNRVIQNYVPKARRIKNTS